MTRLAIACFALGVILMVGFDYTATRVVGVALLFAFVGSGVWAIADPAELVRDGRD